MKKVLNQLFDHHKLSATQAKEILIDISKEKYNPAQVASFISVYLMRGISVEELGGFRSALLELCIPVDLGGIESIDVCGTGGDGKNTFNISTASSFVIAGAGIKVSKHGNYGVSSICGSSNVLEYLGYSFSNNVDLLKKQLDKANICFFHAPLFHPALKSVGPIRKQLGVKTFFNLLGPLVNPARPSHQLVGVFNLKTLRLYQYLLQQSTNNFSVLHSLDGYDEVSLTSKVRIAQKSKELLLSPNDLLMPRYKPEDIYGGEDIASAAQILTNVLDGKGTSAQTDVVLVNSALAIQTINTHLPLEDCIAKAKESIASGRAKNALTTLIEFSK